jgi:transmembrane sensor
MNYLKFTAQEFLMDRSFVQWARDGENDDFWQSFMTNNPSKMEEIEQARSVIDAMKTLPMIEMEAENQRLLWERVEEKINEETPARTIPLLRRMWWVAACILMVAGWFGWQIGAENKLKEVTYEKLITTGDAKKSDMVEYVNSADKVLPISLPDGSSISLRKGSRVAYFKSRFGLIQREVYISGEAFFEVTKNPAIPFVVYSNELITKVLGTSFTVKAYPDDKQINVYVKTGRVSVFTQFEAERSQKLQNNVLEGVILNPNQRITLDRQELRLSRSLICEPEALPVPEKEGKSFEFDDVSVVEIFQKIEEVYGVEIVYDKELLSTCKITATLTNEPLYEKIRMICQGLGASYKMIDGEIVIESNGCVRP